MATKEIDYSINENIVNLALDDFRFPSQSQSSINNNSVKPNEVIANKESPSSNASSPCGSSPSPSGGSSTPKREQARKPQVQKLKKNKILKTEAIPNEVPTIKHVLKADEFIAFAGRDDFLSNFAEVGFRVANIQYPSVEQYYQAAKLYSLAGPANAAKLSKVTDPFKAKSIAKSILRTLQVPPKEIERWKSSVGITVVLYANAVKFLGNEGQRKRLLDTGNKLLVQAFERDDLYAVGMKGDEFKEWMKKNEGKEISIPYSFNSKDLKYFPTIGKGKNLLGLICMKVRYILHSVPVDANYNDPALTTELLAKIMA